MEQEIAENKHPFFESDEYLEIQKAKQELLSRFKQMIDDHNKTMREGLRLEAITHENKWDLLLSINVSILNSCVSSNISKNNPS